MGNVVHLDVHERIKEDAALWLVRIDRGLGEDERQQLDAWLKANPRHGVAFVELAQVWDKLEQLSALSGLVELPAPRPRRRASAARSVAVAAVTVVVTVAALILGRSDEGALNGPRVAPSVPTASSSEANTAQWPAFVSTKAGELRTVVLPDGTSIAMNTRSTLRTQLVGRERRVELVTGEATFNVAHDPMRPFVVRAAGQDIRAVGTVFTVHAQSPSKVSVLVTDGQVAVSRRPLRAEAPVELPDARLLEAGDRLLVSNRELRIEHLSTEAIDEALAWQNGVIVFQGESLAEAIAEVARYSDTRIQLADESIGSMRVAGVYRVEDLDVFIHSLGVNLGVGATRLPDGSLSLYRKGSADGETPPNQSVR